MKTQTSMGGRMTMTIPKPTLMAPIIEKKLITTNYTGKSGTTSGGNMAGCTACGTATKTVPAPKKM